MKKLVVTGTRKHLSTQNKRIVEAYLSKVICDDYANWLLAHGDCQTGIDAYAQNWAERHGVQSAKFAPLWKRHGSAAGPIRNRNMLMAIQPDYLLAFPMGESPGTRGCWEQAKLFCLPNASLIELCEDGA